MENPNAGASSETHQSPPAVGTSARGRRSRRSAPRAEAPVAAAAKRRNSGDDSTVSGAQCRKRARKSLDSSQRKAAPAVAVTAVAAPAKEDDTPCCICMCDIDRPDLSSIDGCTHQYCFDCIAKWAKTENTCPQCKTRFTKISRVHLTRASNGKRSSKRDPNNTLAVSDRSQQERTAALEGMVFRGSSGNPIYFDSEDDDAVAFAVGLALSLQYVSGETLHDELARHLRRRGHQETSSEEEDDEEDDDGDEDESDESSDTPEEQPRSHPYAPSSRPGGAARYVEQAPPTAATLVHGPTTVTTAVHTNIPLAVQILQEQQRLQVQALREMERMLPPFLGPAATSGLHHLFAPAAASAAHQAAAYHHQPSHGIHHHHHAVNALAELSSAAASSLFGGRHLHLPVDFHHHQQLIMPSRFAVPPPPMFHHHQHQTTAHHGISISNLTAGNGLSHISLTDLFFPALAGLHPPQHLTHAPAPHPLPYPMNMALAAASQAHQVPGAGVFPPSATSAGLSSGNSNPYGVQHALPPALAPAYPTSTSQYHQGQYHPGYNSDLLQAELFFAQQHHPHSQYPPNPDRSHMP